MADKRSKLAEYFGLEELPPLTMADGVMRGIGRMSDQASEYLGPAGAKLDAKLGTVGYREDAASPDVFANRPAGPLEFGEGAPLQRKGLFERLGAGVPQIAGFVAGNEVPMAGPVAPRGSVAAFPSPKQSFQRMKEEAVFRDLAEAKGRVIEPHENLGAVVGARSPESMNPVIGHAKSEFDAALASAPPRGLRDLPDPVEERAYRKWADLKADAVERMDAAELANRSTQRPLPERGEVDALAYPDGQHAPDFYGIQGLSASDAREANQFAKLSTPNPRARVPAEQTELERYLAGLYGPKAK